MRKTNMNNNNLLGFAVQTRTRESTPSPSFYRSIYSQIEEVGWEHLVNLSDDLSSVSFRIPDKQRRSYIVEIGLPEDYPESAPSVTAEVPYICQLRWSKRSRLKDVVCQFSEHLEKLQEFWSTMDDIDRHLLVVDPRQASRATTYRRVDLGDECHLLLAIDASNPRSLPECRFFGPDAIVDILRKKWRRNSRKWTTNKSCPENLGNMLETALPGPPNINEDDKQVDCGICYAQYLPIGKTLYLTGSLNSNKKIIRMFCSLRFSLSIEDDELEDQSGSPPDYTCDNPNCSRAFHSLCLRDWLLSITTTRQSFDVLFGDCPYCSGPVAVKINSK
ncbi:hypothetical protein QJS04_geneDACA022107 [Acorus gramineus]|uniref:E3 ubiquitin-protein ligase FANCL n=1 Tax=Acorus gramineus TaxID=55184 RepID=A0AAV9AWY6_ACOGR|nr:hypothetical protein QJS04_geneDACA022107 [Acorus gramineus]